MVLVADPSVPHPPPPSTLNPQLSTNSGTVEFTSYAPKRIVLQAKAGAPAILLLNDRFDPNWKVSVDGKPGDAVALQLSHARRLFAARHAYRRVSV